MPYRDLVSALHDARRLRALAATELLDAGPDEAFDRLGRLARRVLDAPIALVSLVDEARQWFATCQGLAEPASTDRETPLTHSICQHVLVSDGPLVITDLTIDSRVAPSLPPHPGALAYLGVPLVEPDGDVLGSLCVMDLRRREWTDAEVALLEDLGHSVMAEINLRAAVRRHGDSEHRLRSLVELEATHRFRTEQLLRLAKALTGARDLDDILQRTSRIGGELVGAAFANIAVLDPETGELELRHGTGLNVDIVGRWPHAPLNATTPLGMAILSGVPVHLGSSAEIRAAFSAGADDAIAAGFKSLAAYPIRRGRSGMGFAWAEATDFTPALRSSLATVVELVGLGLDRATAGERDRRVAERLQRSLLPQQLPSTNGATLAAIYEAGAAGLHVGGDWYDIVTTDDGFIVGLGDVVGRGLGAAVAMGQLRNAFSALALSVFSLAEVVEGLDRFASGMEGARLSTMVAVSFQGETGAVSVIAAGHLPPMVRRRDGSVEQLPDAGPPLALGEGLERTTWQSVLAPGEVLVLYTDGLVERRGESIDVGLARLRSALESTVFATAREIVDDLYQQLGRPHDDDVAALVIASSPTSTT